MAIVGTGSVGAALTRGLAGKGHAVTLGTRNPEAEAVRALAAQTGSRAFLPRDAAEDADLVILALPWDALGTAVAGLGDLSGRIVID